MKKASSLLNRTSVAMNNAFNNCINQLFFWEIDLSFRGIEIPEQMDGRTRSALEDGALAVIEAQKN
ncbi:MAG TPA: hypothetical protein VI112_12525 [Bacteroidia bacterium]|jgi:hypothetical protein